ncbi:MAG: oligosaccharide flippase family protein [Ruminococcus sp.]|nr:oligosaccharide flippase family protein [Ruminococcus sp.]
MSRKSNLAKSTLILSIGTFLPKLASFITLPILTGYLTKKEYGTYDLITVLVSLLLPQLTLQIKSAAFRFLLDVRDNPEKQKEIVSNIFIVTLPVSVVALIVLFFLLPGSTIVRLFICFYYLADILVNTIRQISRGIGKNLPYSISAVISALGKMIFAVLLISIFKLGLLGAVVALGIGSFLSMIYISIHIKILKFINFKYINKNTIKEMLTYSWPVVPNEMSLWVMSLSDRLIITSVFGVEMEAVLAAATKIPSLINLAQSALGLAWQENASITVKDKDSSEYYSDMFRVMINLQAGVYSSVVAAAPILFKILIKGDYGEAYFQIPFLCLGIFFSGLASFIGGIYVGYKKTKSIGFTSIGAAVINILVDILLVRYIGLYAASISTLISYFALFVFRIVNVQTFVKVKLDLKLILVLFSIMILELILCYQQTLICNLINVVLALFIMLVFNKQLLTGGIKTAKKLLNKNIST